MPGANLKKRSSKKTVGRKLIFFLAIVVGCSATKNQSQKNDRAISIARERKNCWQAGDAPTLLSVMEQAMQTPLEPDLVRDNYIQTFGGAYEEVDIEKNAIEAVYRAILQSLRNRNITARDNLKALLKTRPPRPDNLVREYTIYVNMPKTGPDEPSVASYHVKVLSLELVRTVESPVAIWTRIATRFMHREDHYRALPVKDDKSEFYNVIQRAQTLLMYAERGRMEDMMRLLQGASTAVIPQPRNISDLAFGDQLQFRDLSNPQKTYPGIFLGKGIIASSTPRKKVVVFKFGEERLFNMRFDPQYFKRTTEDFVEFGYKAPETILQCLFLKSERKKPSRVNKN